MPDDIVELIPVNEQDEAVYRAWEAGKGLRALSREFALSLTQIEQILDRMLPAFDAQNQLRAFKREIERLESLSSEFYTIAKRDKCRDSAHLVARLNERICAMRGWSPVNVRMDPLTADADRGGQGSFQKLYEMVLRIGKTDLNGADADRAVGALS